MTDVARSWLEGSVFFANNWEMGFVGCLPKLDKVSIISIQHIVCVWIVVWLGSSLTPDVVHNLVLTFSRYIRIKQNDS